jgi:hypothetical protein
MATRITDACCVIGCDQNHIPDLSLLRKVFDQIQNDPETWDQKNWARKYACNTAYCVAGHAAVMSGHEIRWGRAVIASGTTETLTVSGAHLSVPEVARHELGLDEVEANILFSGSNTLDMIRGCCVIIAARVGERF